MAILIKLLNHLSFPFSLNGIIKRSSKTRTSAVRHSRSTFFDWHLNQTKGSVFSQKLAGAIFASFFRIFMCPAAVAISNLSIAFKMMVKIGNKFVR
ncbi:MAG: hypothetical protein C5B59_13780 [Bacteroidetes bacterium]|nr:MAG: hypothetical protein C5B59_13780 [Bacteroidota bacterium]